MSGTSLCRRTFPSSLKFVVRRRRLFFIDLCVFVSGRSLLSRGDEESFFHVSRRSSTLLDRVEHRHSSCHRSRVDSDEKSRIDRMSSVV